MNARAHQHAPWTVVAANDKLHARVKILKTVVGALEKAVGGPDVSKRLRKVERKLKSSRRASAAKGNQSPR